MESAQESPRQIYKRKADLASSIFYMGSIVSFLTKREETDGRFALMELRTQPGNEPPPHVHVWEDEVYYLLEGEMEFYCEDRVLSIGPGDVVFLPKRKPHAFNLLTPFVRTLILVQAADEHTVGLDRYFVEMGEPAQDMRLPDGAVTYNAADPQRAISVGAANGILILSPDEASAELPHYPGFGMTPERLKKVSRSKAD